jgi:hypothetical protein
MPRVGFEPRIPAFERAKTVHALYRAATVIARPHITYAKYTLDSGQRPRIFSYNKSTIVTNLQITK